MKPGSAFSIPEGRIDQLPMTIELTLSVQDWRKLRENILANARSGRPAYHSSLDELHEQIAEAINVLDELRRQVIEKWGSA